MRHTPVLTSLAVAAMVVAGPAVAADLHQGQARQMHPQMGTPLDSTDARAAARAGGVDFEVRELPDGTTVMVVTQRHAYPQLFAAEVAGRTSVEEGQGLGGASGSVGDGTSAAVPVTNPDAMIGGDGSIAVRPGGAPQAGTLGTMSEPSSGSLGGVSHYGAGGPVN